MYSNVIKCQLIDGVKYYTVLTCGFSVGRGFIKNIEKYPEHVLTGEIKYCDLKIGNVNIVGDKGLEGKPIGFNEVEGYTRFVVGIIKNIANEAIGYLVSDGDGELKKYTVVDLHRYCRMVIENNKGRQVFPIQNMQFIQEKGVNKLLKCDGVSYLEIDGVYNRSNLY